MKALTISGAKMKQPKDSTEMIMVPVEKVNITAFLTLPYFLAPQLYAQTGWKPCPKPRRAEKRKNVTLPVMLMAAMAASP